MKLTSSYVQPNEVVKATDINYGFDSQIQNIATMVQGMLESEQDFVINGVVSEYASGMNVSIAPIFGIHKATGIPFLNSEKTEPIAVGSGWDVDRIDTIEIKGELTETTEEQRAFIDFDTKEKTFQNVNTRKEQNLVINVKKNPNDGNFYSTAPTTSSGYVKLAEIYIPANATSIDECTIYNITSDIAQQDNDGWTNEENATYNIGYISSVNKRFREEHNEDGTHKENVIHAGNIDFGSGSNQVNGSNIPIGQAISVNGTEYGANTAVKALLSTLAEKVTDLFNSYLKNGEYQFNGELSLLNVLTGETDLSKILSFYTDEDGKAYIKLLENTIVTFTEDKILVSDFYDASTGKTTNSKELATRAVTNALWDYVKEGDKSLDSRVTYLENNADPTVAVNRIFNKFTVTHAVRLATTTNITLSGLQTIDGKSVSGGDYILVKDQTDKTENGVYKASDTAWNRDTYIQDGETGPLTKVFIVISDGNQKGKTFYSLKDKLTTGTDEIDFIEADRSTSNIADKLVLRDENGDINVGKVNNYTPASAMAKTAGSAVGNVPVVGTALGTTNNNIVVTDASGNLKPSGTVIGSAAGKTAGAAVGNVPLVGTALGTTNNNIVVTDANGNLKPAAYTCGAASEKGVDTTASTTSTNVPTTAMAISSGNAGAVCSTAASTQIKAITLSGFALYSGVTVKVMFTLGNSSDNPRLKINSLADKAIMVVDAGAKKAPVNHTGYWRGETSTRSEMWQPYTILELMYDGTDFVIMGNPTVESWHNDTSGYEVKANGLIEQSFFYNSSLGKNALHLDNFLIIYKSKPNATVSGIVTVSSDYRFATVNTITTSDITVRSGGDNGIMGYMWIVRGY